MIFEKPCLEHGDKAIYCSIERKWVCPKCPQVKFIQKTKHVNTAGWYHDS